MSKHLLFQTESFLLKSSKFEQGYQFNLNNHSYEKLIIYDKKLIANVLNKKYQKMYQKLLKLFEDADGSEEAFMICLDEEEKLRGILENNYQKYLDKQKYLKYSIELNNMKNYLQDVCIKEKGRR